MMNDLNHESDQDMYRAKLMNDIKAVVKKKKLPPLLDREFISFKNGEESKSGPVVRIMQWNSLAQALSGDNFVRCPPEALEWETRKFRVLEEILRFNASIVCLQEVDHFSYIEESLKPLGFAGIFLAKPHSVCLRFENNNGPDGCAVFYSTDRYDLLHQEELYLKNEGGVGTNQVAILCKFQVKGQGHISKGQNVSSSQSVQEGQIFHVVVTHLKAKPGFEEKRFQQGKDLLEHISSKCSALPLIICGDFNAEYTEKVYTEFKNSPLKLTSAYTNLSDDKSEPPYTTWKIRMGETGETDTHRTIDYLWHTASNSKILTALSIPTEDQVGPDRIPSFSYPSDHFSLVCDIQLI